MNRWLMIGSLVALMIGSTGCLRHNTRGCGAGCASGGCATGACGGGCMDGSCGSGSCGSGLLGRAAGLTGMCNGGGCRTGCVPGALGWQQGGHDYSSHLQPGLMGHRAQSSMNYQGFNPGPPTAQVGYPYYVHRGPRDFLLDNPPTIGR